MLLESPVLQTLSVRPTIPEVTVIETETIKIMQSMLQHILNTMEINDIDINKY
jgi:hypothetical protein